jgi:hypothetical protein
MRRHGFLVASAVLEAGAGLALLLMPSPVLTLLLASPASRDAVAVGRLAGAALLSLGAACWWSRADADSSASRALVAGMSVYNAAVIAIVLTGSFGSPGRLVLAVAAVLHAAMAAWGVSLLRR